MAFRPFRALIKLLLPSHLSDRGEPTLDNLARSNGYRRLYVIAAMVDLMLEAAMQGLWARMPGRGTPTALPLIGRDRMLVKGPTESVDGYAARLRGWLGYWRLAGNALTLMRIVRAYLSPNAPLIRCYLRSGFCWTLELDGSLTWIRDTEWDWDSVSHPERATGHQTDIWLVIYSPSYPDAGVWTDTDDDEWGGPASDEVGVGAFGLDVSAQTLEILREEIIKFKGPHCWVRNVIFSFDATLFDPTSDPGDPGMPDGQWGRWSKISGGASVPSRHPTARYWEPSP